MTVFDVDNHSRKEITAYLLMLCRVCIIRQVWNYFIWILAQNFTGPNSIDARYELKSLMTKVRNFKEIGEQSGINKFIRHQTQWDCFLGGKEGEKNIFKRIHDVRKSNCSPMKIWNDYRRNGQRNQTLRGRIIFQHSVNKCPSGHNTADDYKTGGKKYGQSVSWKQPQFDLRKDLIIFINYYNNYYPI